MGYTKREIGYEHEQRTMKRLSTHSPDLDNGPQIESHFFEGGLRV